MGGGLSRVASGGGGGTEVGLWFGGWGCRFLGGRWLWS